MIKILKKSVARLLSIFSLKLSHIKKSPNKNKWLKDLNIETIIDVGGSKGNAALQFHALFPSAEIYSFEPLSDCFRIMNEKMGSVAGFRSFNVALSDNKGKGIIHRSSYSGSSSLRKMADIHKLAFPITAGERDEVIKTDTMDNVMKGFNLEGNILVKIDVQGLEDKVILGGQKTLDRAKMIIVETSFIELYEGQPLFGKIYQLLFDMGFRYSGARDPDFRNPLNGASLQQDSIFIK